MAPHESRKRWPAIFVIEPVRITLLSAVIALLFLVGVPRRHDRDARTSAISVLRAEPSPDGRWLAVEGRQGGEKRVWLVGLSQETWRELDDVNVSCASDAWSAEGLLRVRELESRASLEQVRWIEPDSGDTVKVTEEDGARARSAASSTPSWARVIRKSRTEREVVQVVAWPERGLEFELPGSASMSFQLSHLPGVVFYSLREAGSVRVYRYDMASRERRELLVLLKNRPAWFVAPDGQALVADDATHTRVFSADDGKPIAGPWQRSAARWTTVPQWLDESTSRHLLLGWDGELFVIDLVRDHQISLGAEQRFDRLRALADGRFLVEREGAIQLFDERAQLERVVFPPDA